MKKLLHRIYRAIFLSKPQLLPVLTFVNLSKKRVCTRINAQWHVVEPMEAIQAHKGYTELLTQAGLTVSDHKLKTYKRESTAERHPVEFRPAKYD